MLKSAYVSGARSMRAGLERAGILDPFDHWSEKSPTGAWARSLLSIYDLQELNQLDLPWWTVRSSSMVDQFLAGRRESRVFEWGSGVSTLWLARRSASVTSVEHDPQWLVEVEALVAADAPVEIRLRQPAPATGRSSDVLSSKSGYGGLNFADYAAEIDTCDDDFDLIVIDGRAREACLDRALVKLAPDGLILFDNVDRKRYRQAIATHADLDVIWTRGLTPALPYPTRTALIRRLS